MKEATPKDNAIRWMNALNGATAIVAGIASKEDTTEYLKEVIKELADFLYDVEPATTQLEDDIANAKTQADLEALKEAVVKSDSVKLFSAWNEAKIKIQ
jgi:N-acetylglutamate synthase/N-acetylornithine aminotransferase